MEKSSLNKSLFILEKDPLAQFMNLIERLSGVQLSSEKRTMVETRLARRVRALNLFSLAEYFDYFQENYTTEILHALSLITTHTTEFFREEAHFDYLMDVVFPLILNEKKSFHVWSAAASTGQEVYSLAIVFLEFLRVNSISLQDLTSYQIYGSDIDELSLQVARDGVYPLSQVNHLATPLVDRYFDRGSGELDGFVRIKDFVHEICHFQTLNLLNDPFPWSHLDSVFLRNAIIYFKNEDIESLMNRIKPTLLPSGFLFLGHSESLTGLNTPFRKIGNSIYSPQNAASSIDLIVIGASTGGVEALKVVLEGFSPGSAPIVIVQHIPGHFSKPFADRLNETCAIQVCEAKHRDILSPSTAYIAPGGKQLKIISTSSGLMIEINDDPPMGLHKPSVDYLFKSVLPLVKGRKISAALLTGMGADGAQGLKELRNAGAYTVAQNEATSVVYGMPGQAVKMGGAVDVVPLAGISSHLLRGWSLKKVS